MDENVPLIANHHSEPAPSQISSLLFKETRTLFYQSIPVALALVLLNSIGLASVFSLGHLGTKYLAACALTTMFCNITGFSIALGLNSSLDTLCSQAFTASEDKHEVGRHLQRVLMVNFIFSIPIFYIWFHTESILLYFGQDLELAQLSGMFARYLAPGLIPFMISTSLTRYLQAQGIMVAGFIVLLIAAPLNVFLQWFFVFSKWGFGAIGAPIATSATHLVIPVMLVVYTAYVDGYQCWGGIDLKEIFNVSKIKDIFRFGIPGILMICSESWAFEVMALIAGLFGKDILAAQTTMLSACSLLYLFPLGFGVAATNRIGNLLGDDKPRTASLVSKAAVSFGVFLGTLNAMFLFSIRNHWGFLFTADPKVIEHVMELLPLVAVYQVSDGIKAVASGVLQGSGLQRLGATINIIGYYVIGLPLGALLTFNFNYGIIGLWWGITTGLTLISLSQVAIIAFFTNWDIQSELAIRRSRQTQDPLLWNE